ncbi:hypothetical protein J4E08_08605 [Sagittula sp. NFXS13]
MTLPGQARVVIIGGFVIGASVFIRTPPGHRRNCVAAPPCTLAGDQ